MSIVPRGGIGLAPQQRQAASPLGGPRRFEPPRPPTTTVINGQTYLGHAPAGPGMVAGPNGVNQSAPAPRVFGEGTIAGQDGSTWTPMDGGGGGSAAGGRAPGGGGQNDPYDGQIQQLMAELNTNSGSPWSESEIAGPDFSGLEGQQKQLQDRLTELLAGRGIDTGPVANDPEARAYRVASQRAAEAAQGGEADRMATSGVTGGGEADARAAQIREAAGQDVAGFEAGLSGRRRSEAQQSAIQGAGLSLNNMGQLMAQKQATFQSKLSQADMRRQAAAAQRQQKLQLLQTLMAHQGA